ncbi:SDR family oxidoreductase [Paenibacillus sp. WQ 127069]|uniref:SDR family oxidoreductase n=1 Tax=Paenibacillus baimaensis TaxID=2982185 RepID=A0ABT2UAZ7_9BACL|nr:SDR family oxidoreductase [Paenibacillus sp. WQ 127069]MCU6791795.1 SDR family oxidoreductase [Paenibacillus sp. WQ 127069]
MNVLITGANRGLGLAITTEALERGHHVIAGVRSLRSNIDALSSLATRHGKQLEVVELDVTNEEGIAELAGRYKREGRSLGAIINNAAILVARKERIEGLQIEDMERTMDINLYGPMRVVKHFLPLVTEAKAAVINISSEAGSITNAYGGDYPYGLSKAGLNMFTQQLKSYVKDRNILVLSIHPGWMMTDMGGEAAHNDPRISAKGIVDQMERRIFSENSFPFVDYLGNTMPT